MSGCWGRSVEAPHREYGGARCDAIRNKDQALLPAGRRNGQMPTPTVTFVEAVRVVHVIPHEVRRETEPGDDDDRNEHGRVREPVDRIQSLGEEQDSEQGSHADYAGADHSKTGRPELPQGTLIYEESDEAERDGERSQCRRCHGRKERRGDMFGWCWRVERRQRDSPRLRPAHEEPGERQGERGHGVHGDAHVTRSHELSPVALGSILPASNLLA